MGEKSCRDCDAYGDCPFLETDDEVEDAEKYCPAFKPRREVLAYV